MLTELIFDMCSSNSARKIIISLCLRKSPSLHCGEHGEAHSLPSSRIGRVFVTSQAGYP